MSFPILDAGKGSAPNAVGHVPVSGRSQPSAFNAKICTTESLIHPPLGQSASILKKSNSGFSSDANPRKKVAFSLPDEITTITTDLKEKKVNNTNPEFQRFNESFETELMSKLSALMSKVSALTSEVSALKSEVLASQGRAAHRPLSVQEQPRHRASVEAAKGTRSQQPVHRASVEAANDMMPRQRVGIYGNDALHRLLEKDPKNTESSRSSVVEHASFSVHTRLNKNEESMTQVDAHGRLSTLC